MARLSEHVTEAPIVLLDRETFERLDGEDGDATAEWWAGRRRREVIMSCGTVCRYLHETAHPHRVVVWPARDDPNLAKAARKTQGVQVVPYEDAMGPAVSFYALKPS